MLVGLIAILAGIAAYFALGSRGNNPPSAAQAPVLTTASAAASAAAPAAANEKPRAEQPTSAETATEAPREDVTAKPTRAPATWQRPGFTRPARPETPPNEVSSPPVETKSKAPAAPMPTPAPQEDFEKNPYLRR